jgi:VanZ family protein
VRLWLPVAAMLAVQLFLSSKGRLPSVFPCFPGTDKLQHATWFFLLGLLVWRAGRNGEGWTRACSAAVVLGGGLLWGASDELHQAFVPGRAVEALDLVADVIGASLAALLAEPILRRLGLIVPSR